MKTKIIFTTLFSLKIMIFFIFLSCVKKKSNDKKINYSQSNSINFTIRDQLPDTVSLDEYFINHIDFSSKKIDSLYKNSLVQDSLKKESHYLFVYTFDNTQEVPENINSFNEDNSLIFMPENRKKNIEFYYSFKKEGWNKLVLVLLNQLYMPVENDYKKLRLIEEKQVYIDSIFVTPASASL